MVEKCYFQSKSYIILNFILFCILIGVVYYYYKIRTKKKEHFEQSDGCFTHEQLDMDVVMRECGVYYIDPQKEGDCDANFDYYDMTDVQLDYAIKAAQISNQQLYQKLQEIWDYLHGNNFKKCKIKYDNWKEIASYHDKHYQPETKEYVYPKKNTSNASQQINFKLWNSCFGRNTDLNKINFNSTVVPACTTPINNIKDINSEDNQYVSMSFNTSLNYDDVYKSICDKQQQDNALSIPSNLIFMVLHCEYKSRQYVKISDISFAQYSSNRFGSVADTTPAVNTAFMNMFRLTYDKNLKKVVYGPRLLNMDAYLINYDLCKNIKNHLTRIVPFTFRDFNVPNVVTDIILNTVPELIDLLDSKIGDENNDGQVSILENINALSTSLNNELTRLTAHKKSIQDEIDALIGLMTENSKSTQTKLTLFEQYVAAILESRKNTDTELYNYIQALKAFKTRIEEEFNRQKVLIGSGQTITNNIAGYITSENSRCSALCTSVNTKLQDEYRILSENVANIYNKVTETILNMFGRGVFFSLNLYNRGILTRFVPQNEREFSCMIINNDIADNFVNTTSVDPYYFDNRYINSASGMLTYSLELCGNILLEQGYYHFYADLMEEDCYDIFIGYADPDNVSRMIFKNVANYYNSTMRERGGASAKVGHVLNTTTKNPIHIDGQYNNGYYAFYARSLRGIQTLRNNYLNIKYIKLNNSTASYSLFSSQAYEYKAVNTINTSTANNASSILYYNKDLKDLKMISMFYSYLDQSQSVTSQTVSAPVISQQPMMDGLFPSFANEGDSRIYWWTLDNTLVDSVQKNTLSMVNYYGGMVYDGTYAFRSDTKYGNSSLMVTSGKKYDTDYMFKVSTSVTVPRSFSVSFWCKATDCCNKIISIGDNLYISIRKDITLNDTVDNNVNIVYINGISYKGTIMVKEKQNYCVETWEDRPSSCFDIGIQSGYNAYKAWVDSGRYQEVSKWSTKGISCGTIRDSRTDCSGTIMVDVAKSKLFNTLPCEFKKWNHYVLTYDNTSKKLKMFYNGEAKFENQNYIFQHGIMNLSMFNQQSNVPVSVSYNDLRIYNKALSINEIKQLFNNTITQEIDDIQTTVQTSAVIVSRGFPNLNDESSFLSYWWEFSEGITGKVGNAHFVNNTNNTSDYSINTNIRRYGPSSLQIIPRAHHDSFKLSTNINLPNTFTWSFWAYTSGCCNKIASIDDDIFIDVQKYTENRAIYYINQFSEISEKTETIEETCSTTTCEYFTNYPKKVIEPFFAYGFANMGGSPKDFLSQSSSASSSQASGNVKLRDPVKADIPFPKSSSSNSSWSVIGSGADYRAGPLGALPPPRYSYPAQTTAPVVTQQLSCINKITTYPCSEKRQVKIVSNSIESQSNTWQFYTIIYNAQSKTLKYYHNGEFKFEKKDFTYNGGNKTLKLFKSHTNTATVLYSDMRIHSKELSPYEIYCLYNGIVCPNVPTDPGIRKLNNKFYITCPKLPSLSTMPPRPSYSLTYTNLRLPSLLNANTPDYIPIYTQEKTNLENFYSIDDFIDQLDKIRKVDINEYDCMIKAEKQMLTNSVSQESIDNKRSIVERLDNQMQWNSAKLSELTKIYTAMNTFVRYYDLSLIKRTFQSGITFNDNTAAFNKYLAALFKNLKDNRHYMFIALQ